MKKSILPLVLTGIMLPDELLDKGFPGIPTTVSFTKKGLQIRRGWRGNRQKIIEYLKGAIARLELEEGRRPDVLN
jgi:hypothetical protein